MARKASRAQRRRYEHRLRSRVRSQRGCLDSLGRTTRRLLGLRAGLGGRPLSRGEAASRLGISGRRAARLERTGLRTLRVACGADGGGAAQSAPPRVVRLTRSAPALQPASFLPAASAPRLQPAVDLQRAPRGRQSVAGTSSSSTPPSGGGAGNGPVSAAATSAPFDGGSGPGLAIILAICFATLAVLVLVALRRGVTGRASVEPAAAAAPAPPREPVATYVPPPRPADQPAEASTRTSQAARAATVVASSVVGFAVRELVRRRGGRGRRR
ncbi:MAG TPA: hypothetical protein VGC98_02885 [Thermoleophilaceae bacterium]